MPLIPSEGLTLEHRGPFGVPFFVCADVMLPFLLFLFDQARLELTPYSPPTLEQKWCATVDRAYCAPTVTLTPKNHSEL